MHIKKISSHKTVHYGTLSKSIDRHPIHSFNGCVGVLWYRHKVTELFPYYSHSLFLFLYFVLCYNRHHFTLIFRYFCLYFCETDYRGGLSGQMRISIFSLNWCQVFLQRPVMIHIPSGNRWKQVHVTPSLLVIVVTESLEKTHLVSYLNLLGFILDFIHALSGYYLQPSNNFVSVF